MENKEKEEVFTSESALDNKCPSCNAPMTYNAKLKKFKCDYCGNTYTLNEIKKTSNAAKEVNNTKEETQVEKDKKEKYKDKTVYVSYQCNNCGAEIITDDQVAATFCVYCGNTAVIKSKLTGKFAPDYIIPFSVEESKAKEKFQNILKGRPLAPRDFVSASNIEKIKGVYIPFWLYDIDVNGSIDYKGNIVTTWTTGNTIYTKTSTYSLNRAGGMSFNKVPCDGSTRFDNDIMSSIEPFDYGKLEEYNHAYLSGFLAEKYDVESDKAYEIAKDRALKSAKSQFDSTCHHYTALTVVKNDLVATQNEQKYAMLPVYMVNVKYKDGMHIFAMNGETGKFIGNIPIDKKRVVVFSIIIFIVTCLVYLLIAYIGNRLGG